MFRNETANKAFDVVFHFLYFVALPVIIPMRMFAAIGKEFRESSIGDIIVISALVGGIGCLSALGLHKAYVHTFSYDERPELFDKMYLGTITEKTPILEDYEGGQTDKCYVTFTEYGKVFNDSPSEFCGRAAFIPKSKGYLMIQYVNEEKIGIEDIELCVEGSECVDVDLYIDDTTIKKFKVNNDESSEASRQEQKTEATKDSTNPS